MDSAYTDPSNMLSCLTNLCTLDSEEILHEILQDKNSSYICRSCDEVAKATSRCKECDEMLCNNCVRAHVRVKLTKDHCITPIEDHRVSPSSSAYSSSSNVTGGNSPNSVLSANSNPFCDLHLSESVRLYCDSCSAVFCQECTLSEHMGHSYIFLHEALECARNSSLKLLTDAKMSAQAAKECLDLSQRMLDTINARSETVIRELRNMMRKFHLAIEERERELLTKVEKIRIAKYKAIEKQIESFRTLFACFTQSSKTLSEALEIGAPLDIIQARDSISAELRRLRSIRANMPQVDDNMCILPPDCSILLAISGMGDVRSGLPPPNIGDELLRNIFTRPPPNYQKRNYLSDFSSVVGTSSQMPVNFLDKSPFRDMASKFPFWTAACQSRDAPPPQPPLILKPQRLRFPLIGRNYSDAGEPVLIIGSEGEEDGEFCRPWGVCCTAEGNIIVADRSNNRVQIFAPDGTFIRKFGSHGTEPGYFDRPAGVATDPRGRIIVTDKDNHRIQVFTADGTFLFTFGDKGTKPGQFNYPWDLAVDSDGKIVVSDTRNHRIQLFDKDGSFIAKYGFENAGNMVKHFDSPRGVCFGSKGCVIATDFNNHRLVVVDPNFRTAKFLGNEGCGEKQFLRPQGVAVDPVGNIIVADSRNNRIQVFHQNGSFLHEFGTAGKEPGQLDRPSGVCLTPDNKIVVVDFGNNRVQIF